MNIVLGILFGFIALVFIASLCGSTDKRKDHKNRMIDLGVATATFLMIIVMLRSEVFI